MKDKQLCYPLKWALQRCRGCVIIIITVCLTLIALSHRNLESYSTSIRPPEPTTVATSHQTQHTSPWQRQIWLRPDDIKDFFVPRQQIVNPMPTTVATSHQTQHTSPRQRQIWLRPDDNKDFFVPRQQIVNPMPYTVTNPNDIECSKDKPFLTVLVLSLHQNIQYRNSIRSTWGSVARGQPWPGFKVINKVKIVFLLGAHDNASFQATAREEARNMRDIVMFDFRESYFNLTNKVLMGFKWVRDLCPQTKYVMKVDEDTFVNIPLVLEKLQHREWNSRVVGPYFNNEVTHRFGKYGVSESAYPFRIYPPHVKGNIYFMPTYIAVKILNVSYHFEYVNMEDTFVTGILVKAVGGISFKDIRGDYYSSFRAYKGCEFIKPPRMASQFIFPVDAQYIWQKYKNRSC